MLGTTGYWVIRAASYFAWKVIQKAADVTGFPWMEVLFRSDQPPMTHLERPLLGRPIEIQIGKNKDLKWGLHRVEE